MNGDIIIKIKRLYPSVQIPVKANITDACYDLKAITFNETEDYIEYGLGISLEIPEGYCALIFPRSSISKYNLTLCNSVGVVDSGYRGEVTARFRRTGNKIYNIGDKVCQIFFYKIPEINFVESEELDITNDRKGGYGSTGN